MADCTRSAPLRKPLVEDVRSAPAAALWRHISAGATGQEQTLVKVRVRSFERRLCTHKRRSHFDARAIVAAVVECPCPMTVSISQITVGTNLPTYT